MTPATMDTLGQDMECRPRTGDTGFGNESDSDLMAYMAMAEDDPSSAREAWAEFYGRHVRYLYAVCSSAYGQILGGDTGVADIVSDTFRSAFRNAHLFDPGGIEEPDRIRRRTRAWLGRIAQRLVMDRLRSAQRLPVVHLDLERWQSVAEPERSAPRDDALIRAVQRAIGQLSDKEQTVIRVTYQWYQAGQAHQRLPSAVVSDLAETLQTTPENLRQIRRRALRKIREFLHQERITPPDRLATTESNT
jgi:RNA polymerase sigma factor (sigma-70 family)